MKTLFTGHQLSGLQLPNRIVMAPMTRSRAADTIPNDETALYYAQRAGAGLIVTEGSQVSHPAVGYLFTPGIHTEEQAAGWKKVTHAVHKQGGRIYSQLWHVGRISHVSLHENRVSPVALRPRWLRIRRLSLTMRTATLALYKSVRRDRY